MQFLVGHRDATDGVRVEAQDLEVDGSDALQRRLHLARQQHRRCLHQRLHALEAQRVFDHILELPLGETAGRQLLLHEARIFHRVEFPVCLENRQRLDAIDHGRIAGLHAELSCLVLQDHEVPNEIVGRLVLRLSLPGKIAHQVELPQGERQLVDADRPLDIHGHDVPPVNTGHDIRADPVHLRGVIQKRERNDGEEGDEHHEPALVLADSREHGM